MVIISGALELCVAGRGRAGRDGCVPVAATRVLRRRAPEFSPALVAPRLALSARGSARRELAGASVVLSPARPMWTGTPSRLFGHPARGAAFSVPIMGFSCALEPMERHERASASV